MIRILRQFIIPCLAVIFLFPLSACSKSSTPVPTPILKSTGTSTLSYPTLAPFTQTPYVITASTQSIDTTQGDLKVDFLSLDDGGYFHLFAYSPQSLPLTRLTSDPWDDITPSISPDGKLLAYSSRRNGYWDIYLLDLSTGINLRLTDTPEYDASPTWSPDGAFIAYESYMKGNLDIFVRSALDPRQPPIPLTSNTSTNTSPAWSPIGRQIAFISNRSGEPDVWVADLDHAGTFTDISNNSRGTESHPVWSPDGNKLVWSSTDAESGLTGFYVWDARDPGNPPHWIGSGDWPVWQDNNTIAGRLSAPNQTYLTGYSLTGEIAIPPFLLPGETSGLSVGAIHAILPGPFLGSAQVTQSPLFKSVNGLESALPSGRAALVPLDGVKTPYPRLSEVALNSFQGLRERIIALIGWDALSTLENAFIPLTSPPDPGMGQDWLYTGRAFTLDSGLIQADWMVLVREDFGQQVYWRIYLRTAAQDGSQGMPLTRMPWNFMARTTSSSAYENGGQLMNAIPGGYWIDLTALAGQFGWQRLPALSNWRSYYSGARFNELVFSQGLDWRTAMLQLYPTDILVTPTIVIPPTRTPTRTPYWYRTPTPTRTPTPRPTSTPLP